MDTVEELNNTYFYAGRSNLTASELLFMIFCENTANQLGVQDFGAIVSIVAGLNVLPTRTKPRDAIEGTSLASRGSRKVFGNAKFPWGIRLPSIIAGYPPSTLKIKMVAKISAFTGRAIPVVGWIILAADVSEITWCTLKDYNRIARGNDKIW
ncbi:STM2901 family protein [Yersinia sp. HM-2024]|uniref:STM2901 family protein n=1 Tax=Yersinia sp. HM-2024 TaxID=3344550 RepID=UPI00370D40E3